MIGEAIYIRVSDRKYNLIATKRGNVPTQSWGGKSAVLFMESALTSHDNRKSKKSRSTAEKSRTIATFEDHSDCYQNAETSHVHDVPGTLTTLRAPFVSTSNSLWPNTTQVHPIPVIRLQIAWLQDKHENLFTRRKVYPEGSARRKLWFSRVNKSACVRTLPCYKCFIILNQQRTEKKNRSSSKSTSPMLFIWWRHRH